LGRSSNSPPPELLKSRVDSSPENVNGPVVPAGRHYRAIWISARGKVRTHEHGEESKRALDNLRPHISQLLSCGASDRTTEFIVSLLKRSPKKARSSSVYRRSVQIHTLWKCTYALATDLERGNSRILLPVAANIALQTAGANGGTPGSPTPAGGASLSTM
jgi:hypothetical protein